MRSEPLGIAHAGGGGREGKKGRRGEGKSSAPGHLILRPFIKCIFRTPTDSCSIGCFSPRGEKRERRKRKEKREKGGKGVGDKRRTPNVPELFYKQKY